MKKDENKMNGTEKVNALMGAKATIPAENTAEYWKSKFEEAQHSIQVSQVEQGRVKSLDSRVKELERENAELRDKVGAAKAVSQLTPEERGDIPEEYVGVAAKIASRTTGSAMAGVSEELAQMRKEREQERAEAQKMRSEEFIGRIDRRFPGFLAAIGVGGDKNAAWNRFLVRNQGSVNMALANCDYDSLVYHIERFYREVLEVRPPNGEGGSIAAPDPASHGGGAPAGGSGSAKVYTSEEYDALDEKCMKLRRQGRIEEYRKLRDELETALSEGRVKD